ncbi:hypothetical protein MNBD_ALPHA02-1600 [hydrothermal vent metagenome]|uniref:AttH domain-containing protein n=1 Tax=hydrothermal vent metagenome TaxID=652676 RepID=A0A3B0R215_9ZZZZ
MKLIRLCIMSLIFLLPTNLQAMEHSKPLMLQDDYYKEYWEQYFLFEDGSFVTSQFLIANLPWPVGKHHGIMIATVVTPDGKRTIIKNGRGPDEWGFDKEKFDLFIHVHRLKSDGNKHEIRIGRKDGNWTNTNVTSPEIPRYLQRYDKKKIYMESSFYMPFVEGQGQWSILDEATQNIVTGGGKVQGFGTHVIFNGRTEKLLKNWLRVFGLQAEGNDQPVPFLSSIKRSDGSEDTILTLRDSDNDITEFSNITLKYKDIKKGNNHSTYPMVIEVTARNDTASLIGTIRFTRKIDHFNINEHMNFFERNFAISRASVANYRYIADYDLSYVTEKGTTKLTGKALSEYKDILPPKKKKSKRRKRR